MIWMTTFRSEGAKNDYQQAWPGRQARFRPEPATRGVRRGVQCVIYGILSVGCHRSCC
jgi:hypothetical protein